jgi:hypothetical protein
MDLIIVIITITVVLFLAVRSLYKTATTKNNCAGCSCKSNCSDFNMDTVKKKKDTIL